MADFTRVNFTLDDKTIGKIKQLEEEFHLSRGQSAVIRIAVDELHDKVFNGKSKTQANEKAPTI